MPYCKTYEVREAAEGRWLSVLDGLAPDLRQAIDRAPRHVPCPVHGGRDGFRLFKDADLAGGGICNTCGAMKDGFSMLQWVNGWDFETAKHEVGRFLDVAFYPTREEREQERIRQQAEPMPSVAGEARSRGAVWRQDLPEFTPKRPVVPASAASAPEEHPSRSVVTESASAVGKAGRGETQASQAAAFTSQPTTNVHPIRPSEKGDADPGERGQRLEERRRQLAKRREKSNRNADRRISQYWSESVTLGDHGSRPALDYLRSRKVVTRYGQVADSETVRFHARLPYYTVDEDDNVELKGHYPALVAAVRNAEGQLVTLHRTFLTRTGKKLTRYGAARKMMSIPDGRGEVSGGAIQLGKPVDGVLGLAEGLETALSAYRATGIPCWSTISATLLEKVVLPQEVHTVYIWGDRDRSGTGEASARALRDRLQSEGVKAHILMPAMPIPRRGKSVDWNDVMLTQGMLGFPRLSANLKHA